MRAAQMLRLYFGTRRTMDAKTLILTRLRDDLEPVIRAFAALTPEQWAAPVYSEGATWTPREILAHQLTTERAIHALVADVLAGGQGAPAGFDVNAFNQAESGALAGHTPAELYAAWRQARQALITLVAGMAAADFARPARHPWFGRAPLEDVLKLVYRHNKIHMRDVQRMVKTA